MIWCRAGSLLGSQKIDRTAGSGGLLQLQWFRSGGFFMLFLWSGRSFGECLGCYCPFQVLVDAIGMKEFSNPRHSWWRVDEKGKFCKCSFFHPFLSLLVKKFGEPGMHPWICWISIMSSIQESHCPEPVSCLHLRATGPIFSMPASWRFVGECDVMQVADHLRIHQSTPITSSCVIHGGFVVTFGGLMESTWCSWFLISELRILDSTRVSMWRWVATSQTPAFHFKLWSQVLRWGRQHLPISRSPSRKKTIHCMDPCNVRKFIYRLFEMYYCICLVQNWQILPPLLESAVSAQIRGACL